MEDRVSGHDDDGIVHSEAVQPEVAHGEPVCSPTPEIS